MSTTRKLGSAQEDKARNYVVVQVTYHDGSVTDVEYYATEDQAERRAKELNANWGHGGGFVHGYMSRDAFEALDELEDGEDEDEDDKGDDYCCEDCDGY